MNRIKKNIRKRSRLVDKYSKPFFIIIITLVVLTVLSSLLFFSDNFVGEAIKISGVEPAKNFKSPPCSDGIDNDKDGFTDWGFAAGNDKFCSSPFDNSEADKLHTNIGWNDFPDFNLNPKLTAVYNGIQLAGCYQSTGICVEDVGTTPLKKGFTHIATFESLTQKQKDSIPSKNRAATWVPFGRIAEHQARQEPLSKHQTPWNNNLELFNSAAKEDFKSIADQFTDSAGTGIPNVDLLVGDLETALAAYDSELIALRKNPEKIPFIPPEFRLDAPKPLTDTEFINQYKHDMAWMINHLNERPKSNGFKGKVGSYGDVPLNLHEYGWLWYESGRLNWTNWTSPEIFNIKCNVIPQEGSNPPISCADYLTFNFGEYMQKPKADFFKLGKLITQTDDLLAPSGYYWIRNNDNYDATWAHTGDNFYYHLFELDANVAFSQGKPVIIFDWMRVFGAPRGIDPWLAHTTSIFNYFTKNSGSWLWDWIGFDYDGYKGVTTSYISENRIAYDNYIYGLYRLSQYNQFFNGNYQVYHPIDAQKLYQKHTAVWRGVIKEDKTQMLVAALNPYANPFIDEVTKFSITCPPNVSKCKEGSALGEVKTIGQNTWLGVCNLDGSGCTGDEGKLVMVCGNGKTEWGEECDDRNILNGDGCSASCKLEKVSPLQKKNPRIK